MTVKTLQVIGQDIKSLLLFTKLNVFTETLKPTNTEIDAIDFLKSHKTPWNIIEQKWLETYNIRRIEIQENSIDSIFTLFPLLGDSVLGYLLVSFC